ncbi:MAG: CCA tRNA nucleotidyltransferase [Planctomycetes bacterium]|nr:CCA tRNA nucleotidyltransferase [Planctomycetota bacterium]
MNKGATRELAVWVIKRLRKAGFEALLAGGCVRDMLLGMRPSDYDVATSATPQQVGKLFGRVMMIGAKFGVAMVLRGGRTIEVATFRSDLSYTDGRRPTQVVFSSARQDALRRDFTINGMFLDPLDDRIIDYVDGQADLRGRLVRAIGAPGRRFGEDYLRMLRAARFAARLDFSVDPATARAIRRHAGKIASISGERIYEELEKMLGEPNGEQAMALVGRLGLAVPIFGKELAAQPRWAEAMERLERLAADRDVTLSLAAVLMGEDAEQVSRLTRWWGASNQVRKMLLWLTERPDAWSTAAELPLSALKRLMSNPAWTKLRKLWRVEELRRTGRETASRKLTARTSRIAPEQVSPPPLITGGDLKAMGLGEGPRLGRLLRQLYELQLAEEIRTPAQAKSKARQLLACQNR